MQTIRSSREIDSMFRTAARASSPLVILLVAPLPEHASVEGRVCFIAGRKLGGAVHRNRARRVLREAARRGGAPWAGYDVALIARPGATAASAIELDRSLASALHKAGVR